MARSPLTRLTDKRRDEVDALVRANIGLAYSEARRWGPDLSYGDQESAGLVGLARACSYWEPGKGRLSTIASIFIRCECSNLQRRVIRLRFGIGVPKRLTLRQVGERMGVSKERVRQIQDKAMAIMRSAAP